jgi:hypothetical protein
VRCKSAKIRCTDNRPCKRCANAILECVEVKSESSRPELDEPEDIQDDANGTSYQARNPSDINVFISRNAYHIHPNATVITGMHLDQNKEKSSQPIQTGMDQPAVSPGHPKSKHPTIIQEAAIGRGRSFDDLYQQIDESSSSPTQQLMTYSQQVAQSSSYPLPMSFLPAIHSSMLCSNTLPCIPKFHVRPTSASTLLPSVATLLHAWDSPALEPTIIPPPRLHAAD